MKILIIEDEQPAALQLSNMLRKQRADIVILNVLDAVSSAVAWLKNNPSPDLIFMDIQIADGLSFEVFKQVQVTCPTVFTTAYDHYAIQAFKVNAIDYLLKPLDPIELSAALERYDKLNTSKADIIDISLIHKLLNKQTYKGRFLVKSGAQLAFVQTPDICFFRSSEGLTQAYLNTGKRYFIDHSLDELEQLIDPKDFFRVNRQLTVQLNSIGKISPHLNGRLKLELQPINSDEEIYVSRERAHDFKTWLGG